MQVLIFLSYLALVWCQFPLKCMNWQSIEKGECCPIGEDGTPCNSGSLRGVCARPAFLKYNTGEHFSSDSNAFHDPRLMWPKHFYEKMCHCQANFRGFDCGSCAPGFHGKNCEVKYRRRKRRDALSLAPWERQRFVSALVDVKHKQDPDYVILIINHLDQVREKIKKANTVQEKQKIARSIYKRDSYWNVIAWMHYYASRAPTEKYFKDISKMSNLDGFQFSKEPFNFAHRGAAFLVWHRHYLLFAESRIQKASGDTRFTFPYWNWVNDRSKNKCSVCTNDLVGEIDYNAHTIEPNYLWTFESSGRGYDKGNAWTTRTGRRLSSKSPFSQWKVICGVDKLLPLFSGYPNDDLICQGAGANDEYLTRHVTPGWSPTMGNIKLPNKEEVRRILKVKQFSRVDRNNYRYINYKSNGDNSGITWSNKRQFESHNQYTRDSFSNMLEGFIGSKNENDAQYIHNIVHEWIGGAMVHSHTAVNDPIFFLHHANIDRIFEMWLQKHSLNANYNCENFQAFAEEYDFVNKTDTPQGCPMGHDRREFMLPFLPPVTPTEVFRMAESFGYGYDNLLVDGKNRN